MVDGKERERKKDPEGRAADAAAAHSLIRSLDVVKWLVRKCERDNDRLCMTPLGAHRLSCEAPPSPPPDRETAIRGSSCTKNYFIQRGDLRCHSTLGLWVGVPRVMKRSSLFIMQNAVDEKHNKNQDLMDKSHEDWCPSRVCFVGQLDLGRRF